MQANASIYMFDTKTPWKERISKQKKSLYEVSGVHFFVNLTYIPHASHRAEEQGQLIKPSCINEHFSFSGKWLNRLKY